MRKISLLSLTALAVFASQPAIAQRQMVDPDFTPRVDRPAYTAVSPVVVVDEAHQNFHTASGGYAPFAALLRADGLTVKRGETAFDQLSLAGVQLLVIANAGSAQAQDTQTSAFAASEILALEHWVKAGGGLLLIADHAPFGVTAENLAARFGVDMGKGWAFVRRSQGDGLSSQLEFSRADGSLADHPITQGRDANERVERVRTFTGQSLKAPTGAAVLLRLPDAAWEAPDRDRLNAANDALRRPEAPDLDGIAENVGGHAQGIALNYGSGRVVVLGEAAMFSAQKVEFDDGRPAMRMGMNITGNDNQQFALNVVHWLLKTLP